MAREVLNPNFFKKKPTTADGEAPKPKPVQLPQRQEAPAPAKKEEKAARKVPREQSAAVRIRLGHKAGVALQEASAALRESGQPRLAEAVGRIASDASRDRFIVAAVGEVGRGKSTFLNGLTGKPVLPVGDLPTTAMLTRVRCHTGEALAVFDTQGKRLRTLPLQEESWDDLLADPFGDEDPKGSVLVLTQSPWLAENGIELLGTPGLGSPESGRAKIISAALGSADAAVMAVSATLPLSMSEKEFLQKRILDKRIPFAMLVITKLDQLPLSRRGDMVDYITGKLKQWNMDIPVFIPGDVQMPDDRHNAIRGIETVKRRIASWVKSPERIRRTEAFAAARALDVVNTGIRHVQEQTKGLSAEENTRLSRIQEKKQKLEGARKTWNSLRGEMSRRQAECVRNLNARVQELSTAMTERLQYEAAHSSTPQKWWEEDYPYRVKVEMGNFATAVNDAAARIINEDLNWFNRSLDKCFKTYVTTEREQVLDKEQLQSVRAGQSVEMESLDTQRNAAKLAVTAISIAGSLALSGVGLAVLSSMGVSAGGNMLTDHFFKDKTDKQREAMKAAIAEEIPNLIGQSMAESEAKIAQVYEGIIADAVSKEEGWIRAQEAAIEDSHQPRNTDRSSRLAGQLARLEGAKARLENITI